MRIFRRIDIWVENAPASLLVLLCFSFVAGSVALAAFLGWLFR